jgi:drug/metabolite transporter (DMT)-like permease
VLRLSDLTDLTDQITLPSIAGAGIPIALVGAVFLALGAQFQHKGVERMEELRGQQTGGISIRSLLALLARPAWVIGTVMLGLAILFQLTSLTLSPILVVQPVGALALVITSILNARLSKTPLDRKSIRAIVMCVGGVAVFVTVAALFAQSPAITELQLTVVLVLLGVVLVAFAVLFITLRKRIGAMFYILGAGVLFGFVATLAKVVIDRIKTLAFTDIVSGGEWLLVGCIVGLLVAALLGSYFVQTAYASGPPDLVVAGLTVIDPLIAVLIGILVLGEAGQVPFWAILVFVAAGAVAVWGVLQLARHHPQLRVNDSLEKPLG